jgi:hypothetical protein
MSTYAARLEANSVPGKDRFKPRGRGCAPVEARALTYLRARLRASCWVLSLRGAELEVGVGDDENGRIRRISTSAAAITLAGQMPRVRFSLRMRLPSSLVTARGALPGLNGQVGQQHVRFTGEQSLEHRALSPLGQREGNALGGSAPRCWRPLRRRCPRDRKPNYLSRAD